MEGNVIDWETNTYQLIGPIRNQVVTAVGQQLWPGQLEYTLGQTGSSEQWQKLVFLFNLFQQVCFDSVTVTYTNRITEFTSTDTQATLASASLGQGLITIVGDHEDPIVRDNNFDEYQQVRMQKNSATCPLTGTTTLRIIPHSITRTMGSNLSTGVVPSSNTIETQAAEWVGTKMPNSGPGGIISPTLNLWQSDSQTPANNMTVYNAIKFYVFTPFPDTTGNALSIGTIWYRIHYKFRYPDYRAIINIASLPLSDEEKIKMLEARDPTKNQIKTIHKQPTLTALQEVWHKQEDPRTETPLLNKIRKREEIMNDLEIINEKKQIRR